MLGSHGLLTNAFVEATKSSRTRKDAVLLGDSSTPSNARTSDSTGISNLPTTDSPSHSSKPLVIQLKNSVLPSSVIHHFGSSSPESFSPNPSDPSSTSPAPASPPSRRPVVSNTKKQKLLKRCHRQLKRLLRSSVAVHPVASGPTASACERCRNCLTNNSILMELQNKYSDLVQEVASLKRQLAAIQNAFTSLRTMLLASFLPSQNNEANSTTGLNTLSVAPLTTSFVAHDPTIPSVTAFPDSRCISEAASASVVPSTNTTQSITHEPETIISSSNYAHESCPLSCPPATPLSSSAVEAYTPIGFVAHSTETSPSYIKLSEPDTLHMGLSTSDKNSSSSTIAESAVSRLDLSVFVQAIRDRMKLLNISQRTLGRELLHVNEKRLGEVLRKPKPWNQLTPHARSIYERLFDWLSKESHADIVKESLNSSSPANNCPALGLRSSACDGASPVPCDPDSTPSTEQALEELCTQTEPIAASPPDTCASPNSFTSAPPSGSDFGPGQDSLHHRSQEPWRTTSLTVGQSSQDSAGGFGGQNEPNSRRLSSNLDQETQNRIRDLLCQARLAMALEKSEDPSNRIEHGTKRRKRAASTESENCSKRALVMNCNDQPATSEALSHDARSDENARLSVSEGTPSAQSSELHSLPSLSALSISVALPNSSDATFASAPSLHLLTSGAEGCVTALDVTINQCEQVSLPSIASPASSVPFTSTTAYHSGTLQVPHRTTPFATFNLNTTSSASPASFPLSTPHLHPASSVPSASHVTLTVPHSLLPGLVQVANPYTLETSHPIRPAVSSLQQTLLLLAAASAARGHDQTMINNTTNLPNAFPSHSINGSFANSHLNQATTLTNNITGMPYTSTASTYYNVDSVKAEERITPDTTFDTAQLASLLSANIIQPPQPLSAGKLTIPDDAILKVFSELNLNLLTSCQLKQLSDCVPPLNTIDLSRQIRKLLRDLNIPQRLFGYFVLGVSQGSVSDLLNKPRTWDQLSPKAKLAFLRLYAWLQQPDRIESLKRMQLTHRQRYLSSIPESSTLNPNGATLSESSSDFYYTESGQVRNQDDPFKLSLSTSSIDASRQEPFQAEYPNESTGSSDQLTELDRQSLFDIARAAAAAMQRANNPGTTGKLARAKAQTDSPLKTTIPPRSVTPLKSDPSAKGVPVSAETSSIGFATISPMKLSPARNRIVFTETQKEALVTTFNRQPYPHSDRLRELAKELDLSYKTVLNWFHNRRMRSRQPLISTDHDGSDSPFSVAKREPVQRNFPDLSFFNGNGPICNTSLCMPKVECELPTLHSACSSSQSGHSNRRKRPDPARLITPCL